MSAVFVVAVVVAYDAIVAAAVAVVEAVFVATVALVVAVEVVVSDYHNAVHHRSLKT